uniref:Uncharacterized protein n=1 Tax=Arundo donax TaxID=35708 RepID=A0A0A9E0J3_ARUDO
MPSSAVASVLSLVISLPWPEDLTLCSAAPASASLLQPSTAACPSSAGQSLHHIQSALPQGKS